MPSNGRVAKYRRDINAAEVEELFAMGFVVLSKWISPVEGVEYRLHRLGHAEVEHYAKSCRACYNAARMLKKKGQENSANKKPA